MSQDTPQDHISRKLVLFQLPDQDRVTIRQDIVFQTVGDDVLTLDLYVPADAKSGDLLPAVIIVTGYPDVGFQKLVGCKFKEMGSSVSWGKLIAASGMIAITYTNREPVADVHALLRFVQQSATEPGIDASRIGLWASSGNVPLALALLMEPDFQDVQCAAFCYGYTLDLSGATHVADVSRMFGFANPGQGKSMADLPRTTPLFFARAGQDQCPHLNETLDQFLVDALRCNLPVSVINHPEAPHAFDLLHDSPETREIIQHILRFLHVHLLK
ncbi:MAG TPA: alpha/beta hydrolase [Acidobacteriota bacterium]|nr:alpha/beta hydrolase [Acidobacteriota bacterium]